MTNSLSGQDQRTILQHLQNPAPNSINPTTISKDEEGNSCCVCARSYVRERDLGRVNGGLKIQAKLQACTWEREFARGNGGFKIQVQRGHKR